MPDGVGKAFRAGALAKADIGSGKHNVEAGEFLLVIQVHDDGAGADVGVFPTEKAAQEWWVQRSTDEEQALKPAPPKTLKGLRKANIIWITSQWDKLMPAPNGEVDPELKPKRQPSNGKGKKRAPLVDNQERKALH